MKAIAEVRRHSKLLQDVILTYRDVRILIIRQEKKQVPLSQTLYSKDRSNSKVLISDFINNYSQELIIFSVSG